MLRIIDQDFYQVVADYSRSIGVERSVFFLSGGDNYFICLGESLQ